MVISPHRYLIEYEALEGQRLGQLSLEPDWEPAVEFVALQAQRRAAELACDPERVATVEPLPHPTAGAPYCAGFRMKVAFTRGPEASADFPITYFQEAARQGSSALVSQGKLKAGDTFRYQLSAFPAPVAAPARASAFTVERIPDPLPCRPGSLSGLFDGAVLVGQPRAEDLPVLIPQHIIEEARTQTVQAGDLETGGLLLGHLIKQNGHHPEIAVAVSAQIPAEFGEAQKTQFTFTPDTWAAVRAAMALRRREEIMVGWWHSHPARYWCAAECPPERRRLCPLTRVFFSSEDVQLHRVIFPKAFTVALVVTHTDEGLKEAVFGWRLGRLEQRAFHVQLNPDRPIDLNEATHPSGEGEVHHEKECPK